MLRLNDESFVWARRTRAELIQLIGDIVGKKIFAGPYEEILTTLSEIRNRLDILIPRIPYELVLQSEQNYSDKGTPVIVFIAAVCSPDGYDHSELEVELKTIPGPNVSQTEVRRHSDAASRRLNQGLIRSNIRAPMRDRDRRKLPEIVGKLQETIEDLILHLVLLLVSWQYVAPLILSAT